MSAPARPLLQGCFHAFATPDELAAHLPRGFWRRFVRAQRGGLGADGGARSKTSEQTEAPSAPNDFAGRREPSRLHLFDSSVNLTVEDLRVRLRPFAIPRTAAPSFSHALAQQPSPLLAVASTAPLLLLESPSAAAFAQQPLLADLAIFDAAIKVLNQGNPVPVDGPAGWGSMWAQCMKMVRNNRCASVC